MDELDRRIINKLQVSIPLEPEPYAEVSQQLGMGEDELMDSIRALMKEGTIRRIAPILNAQSIGVHSTLVALKVQEEKIDEVAERVNSYEEVSHNYEREHEYNMWFTVSAPTPERLERILSEIEALGYPMLNLPTVKSFKINVRFDVI